MQGALWLEDGKKNNWVSCSFSIEVNAHGQAELVHVSSMETTIKYNLHSCKFEEVSKQRSKAFAFKISLGSAAVSGRHKLVLAAETEIDYDASSENS